jgi:protein dithiol oxidoreductase (disulfide-forming)
MKRREFAIALATVPWLASPVLAAGEPVQGRDYAKLSTPVPVATPGKPEVIEFFGYWCPHCNALEPALEAWVKKLPTGVVFRRIPVAWRAPQEAYQKLFFALESLGLPSEIHGKAFDAVHRQGLHLENDAGLAAFCSANGLDKAKVADAMKGFSVSSKVRMANQAVASYHIDGVPTFAVNGRFITSPEMTGGEERTLQVIDALLRQNPTGR